ncbi:MAG TPA: hypothetical protein VI504_12030 [Candidatus Eisenbacteria bacterium]|jgi:hypothetical protein
MTRLVPVALLAAACLLVSPPVARAIVHAGDVPPDFQKQDLNGVTQTLSQYRGKVVFMFLLGYS